MCLLTLLSMPIRYGKVADQCCDLIARRKHGRMDHDIENIPTPLGQAVRVDNIGVLLLKDDATAQVHVTGEHSLKVEVLLNTIFSHTGFPVTNCRIRCVSMLTCLVFLSVCCRV
jgi:hypothetical protein